MNTISSRTPEGFPARCPVCGKESNVVPSLTARDVPCPHCGSLLWLRVRRRAASPLGGVARLLTVAVAATLLLAAGLSHKLSPGETTILVAYVFLLFGFPRRVICRASSRPGADRRAA